jgi:hypothetical protein
MDKTGDGKIEWDIWGKIVWGVSSVACICIIGGVCAMFRTCMIGVLK